MNKKILQQINELLLVRDYQVLVDLSQQDNRYRKALRSYVYEPDEKLYHPAAEAIALFQLRLWQSSEEEVVREYIRGLFWALNDESGGIGWNAPQIIAEIIARIPDLMSPYASMIMDRTMDEPLLIPAGLWAIGRLGRPMESIVELFREAVLATFNSDDPRTLGLAAWSMGEAVFRPALASISLLVDRREPVRIYIAGNFRIKSIGEWAEEAIPRFH